jgi:hypothetical protein
VTRACARVLPGRDADSKGLPPCAVGWAEQHGHAAVSQHPALHHSLVMSRPVLPFLGRPHGTHACSKLLGGDGCPVCCQACLSAQEKLRVHCRGSLLAPSCCLQVAPCFTMPCLLHRTLQQWGPCAACCLAPSCSASFLEPGPGQSQGCGGQCLSAGGPLGVVPGSQVWCWASTCGASFLGLPATVGA